MCVRCVCVRARTHIMLAPPLLSNFLNSTQLAFLFIYFQPKIGSRN